MADKDKKQRDEWASWSPRTCFRTGTSPMRPGSTTVSRPGVSTSIFSWNTREFPLQSGAVVVRRSFLGHESPG